MKSQQRIIAPTEVCATTQINTKFYRDVITGLRATSKYLQSKYFYDAAGDKLFQDIMECEDYYPFACELEIFMRQTAALASALAHPGGSFDLIELGAGDATKSGFLLQHLLQQGADFTYMPIDISRNVISQLEETLPATLPGLRMTGLNGEYFDMLRQAARLSNNRKVVLFLGSTLGNMTVHDTALFCQELREHLQPGDMALIGIDLKKHPKTILAAYNDREGITRKFNLNLLRRINRELHANFDLSAFEHYPTYDPETGSCKSYLVSRTDQEVEINGQEIIRFAKDEHIFMEISQKYTVSQMDQLAADASFKPAGQFFDHRKWFMDAIWLAV
ncbi:L-histidine N(alpha)-methyltransferase [Chitinophaga agrisoli]|uniref:L-histidine N(Alpha)-methyltransferase n=1 Tax=Chitinophaga agrisoli TaxID=2607653 RepID=A0A5B2VXD9_9BACT|nr:L-histidine N(alpha)-methyltransferase [Chitinophaga agrisoli]KAA2243278.1 L-histidine N(alpha)-methyltransferase [Chitinophaga agrisoli]